MNASRYAMLNNEGGTPLEWMQMPPDPRMSSVVASGIEARLIELEAVLQANTPAAREALVAGLNAFCTTAITPAVAPIRSAPTTQAQAVDLLFQERAYWMWLTGHRLGDLRRLIRQYGRSAGSVFPTGTTPPGVAEHTYGDDVNFIIPQDEQNNPNFTGCLNRDA